MAFDSTPSQLILRQVNVPKRSIERLADAIVHAVVGHSLGMGTCAEGVETVEQLAFARAAMSAGLLLRQADARARLRAHLSSWPDDPASGRHCSREQDGPRRLGGDGQGAELSAGSSGIGRACLSVTLAREGNVME
jgi:hypothetical protein